jgi:hypothetical protein
MTKREPNVRKLNLRGVINFPKQFKANKESQKYLYRVNLKSFNIYCQGIDNTLIKFCSVTRKAVLFELDQSTEFLRMIWCMPRRKCKTKKNKVVF